jgi:hypothetical protein
MFETLPAAFGWILPVGGLALLFAGARLFPSRVARAREDAAVAGWAARARRYDLQCRGCDED